jgi:hypothetical protein
METDVPRAKSLAADGLCEMAKEKKRKVELKKNPAASLEHVDINSMS